MTKAELLLKNKRLEENNKILIAECERLMDYYVEADKAIDGYIEERKSSRESTTALLERFQELVLSQHKEIGKYRKAPGVKKQKADDFWYYYQNEYTKRINKGQTQSQALNNIGNLIESEGTWNKKSRKDPSQTLTKPSYSQLYRRLAGKQK